MPLTGCWRLLPLLLAPLVLSACGTYEPPRPGVHNGPLEVRADVRCGYEAATATRFVKYRCEDTRELAERAKSDQRFADDIRPPPPDVR